MKNKKYDPIPWSLIYFPFLGWWALVIAFGFHLVLFH